MKALLLQVIRDWEAHGRDWTKPGFRAIAFHRFGNWRMGIRNRYLRAPMSIIYRFLYRRARNIYGIEIPYTVRIGQNVVIEHQGGIVIHGKSALGDGCIIRQGVTLGNRYKDSPLDAPTLGVNVNVGAGSVILGAVFIGDNVNIGANSVICRDIPDNSTAVGAGANLRVIN